MKIAYLTNRYPAVSHTFVRREIHALEELGVEVKRYSVRRVADELCDPLDAHEAEITEAALDRGVTGLLGAMARVAATRPVEFARAARAAFKLGLHSDRGLAYHGAYLAEACLLLESLTEAGIDHVHAHFGSNPAAVAMLIHELGGPSFSFTVHGPEEFDKPQALKLAAKAEKAEFVVAISSFGRSQLWRQLAPRHWSKVHVVRCGVDEAFHGHTRTAVPNTLRLCCVGRLAEQKGQLLLIEAIGRIVKSGVAVDLALVGDGELRNQIESAIAEHGIGDHVRITGWATGAEVRKELLDSRALVLPSFAEGLPVVIMEALALGRPVISTYVAGIPELVGSAKCGWLIPAGSVDALEGAIRECLSTDVETLSEMGRAGREQVLSMHDARANAASLKEHFEHACERGALERSGTHDTATHEQHIPLLRAGRPLLTNAA